MVTDKILGSLEHIQLRSLKVLASKVGALLEQKLWAKILLGMATGITFGFLLSPSSPFLAALAPYKSQTDIMLTWFALPSKFFLKVIQMVIIPLIIASIIRGLASTDDSSQMRSLGLKFGGYVLLTSLLGSFVGIVLASVIRPGSFLHLTMTASKTTEMGGDIQFEGINPEVLLNILPANPLFAIVQGQMMDIVVISLIGGIALLSIDIKQSRMLLDLLEVIQNISMTIITWAMKIAPYAIFGLMLQVSASTGLKALGSMGMYIVTAFSGFLAFLIFNSMLVFFFKKIGPIQYFRKILNPILLAFSTSSSAATMPMTLKAAEEELNVSKSTANFLVPLGTTVNMAGSAIWHTTAVIFMGQLYGIDLSLGQISFVVATSIGSAIGSPGVPGVGMGVLAAVLTRVGIPIEGIGMIMGVDRIIDMGCTVVNVVGDLTATVIFGKKEKGESV